jgi:hypothetical protein
LFFFLCCISFQRKKVKNRVRNISRKRGMIEGERGSTVPLYSKDIINAARLGARHNRQKSGDIISLPASLHEGQQN